MAKVRIHDTKAIRWSRIGDSFSGDLIAGLDQPTLDSEVSVHEDGDANRPHLSEAIYKAGAEIAVHSHSEDEVIYIVTGSILVGNRELAAGSSLFIEANTLYGFTSGPGGVRMAVFRTRGDDRPLSKDQHLGQKTPG